MAYFNKEKISALCFGIFNSNRWSTCTAYKLTEHFLYADKSETYWSSRFTENGYLFSGDKVNIDDVKFGKVSSLLSLVPLNIFELNLPKNSAPGNKDEYTIFIQVDIKDGKTLQFKVNEYDSRDLEISKNILAFKDTVKNFIKEIES